MVPSHSTSSLALVTVNESSPCEDTNAFHANFSTALHLDTAEIEAMFSKDVWIGSADLDLNQVRLNTLNNRTKLTDHSLFLLCVSISIHQPRKIRSLESSTRYLHWYLQK